MNHNLKTPDLMNNSLDSMLSSTFNLTRIVYACRLKRKMRIREITSFFPEHSYNPSFCFLILGSTPMSVKTAATITAHSRICRTFLL